MGLKRSAALLYIRIADRVRPPRHAVAIAKLLELLDIECLVDVGANRGQFATMMRRAGFRGRILSLEPVSDAFAGLQHASQGDPLWTVERVGVGAEPGRQVIHVSGNSVSSSFLPMGSRHLELAPESSYTRDEEVTVTTIAALVASHGIDPATAMLKADVQGFEWAVLDGAGAALEDFAVLLLELSLMELYDGQPLLPEFIARLTSTGHTLWNFFPAWIDKVEGRLWWADGLFVRSDLAARFGKSHRRV